MSVTGHLFETEWQEYLQESTGDDRVTPSGDDMGSFTKQEAIREAKRCLHCDCRKPASCRLRHYSDEYGAGRKRYAGPGRKRITRSVQHETVVYRGIALRNFTSEFLIGQNVKVTSVTLKNGLLDIDLVRELPETERLKVIPIMSCWNANSAQSANAPLSPKGAASCSPKRVCPKRSRQ